MNTEQMQQWLGQVNLADLSERSQRSEAFGQLDGQSSTLAAPSRFGEAVNKAVGDAHKPAQAAGEAVRSFAKGGEGHMHETMMAVKKGEISFKFMVALKNRALEAYKEVMRMG